MQASKRAKDERPNKTEGQGPPGTQEDLIKGFLKGHRYTCKGKASILTPPAWATAGREHIGSLYKQLLSTGSHPWQQPLVYLAPLVRQHLINQTATFNTTTMSTHHGPRQINEHSPRTRTKDFKDTKNCLHLRAALHASR